MVLIFEKTKRDKGVSLLNGSYDGPAGGLRVYNPESGKLLADLPCGKGHWNSPIVADGRIALPEGLTVGWVFGQGVVHDDAFSVLDIWSLPGH